MKSIITALAIFTILFTSISHSGQDDQHKFTKHFSGSLFQISDKGQVSIEVILDEKEYKVGNDMIGIVIHDIKDHDIEDAIVSVVATGNKDQIKVREKGGGLYLAPKTVLPDNGNRELKISVKKKNIDDSATFRFPASGALPAGKYNSETLKGTK